MTKKFKIGDKVKFKEKHKKSIGGLYKCEYNGIPNQLLIHGNILLGKTYYKKFAEVVATYDKYYIVRWWNDTDDEDKQLGFLEKDLDFVKINNWREHIKNVKKS